MLVNALRAVLPGDAVLAAQDELLAYELDGGQLHPGAPDVVALPRTHEEVVAVMEVARDAGVPVIPRGAGTGLSGGALAPQGGIVLATNRMRTILELDAEERIARVQPGVVNAVLGRAAAPHGLRFAPDPSSQAACTIGGNVAENSGGPHTLRLGVTSNHITGLVLVTSDARSHTIDDDALLGLVTGSEGLFGVVTEISVRLVPLPRCVRTFLASYRTIEDAGRAVAAVIATGVVPAAVELMDGICVRAVESYVNAGFPLDADAVLLVELEGAQAEVDEQEAPVLEALRSADAIDARAAHDDVQRERMWKGRKQAIGALGRISKGFYTHDGVVPPSRLAEALTRIRAIGEQAGLRIASVNHAGDGNLHPLILFDTLDAEELERGAECGRRILETCLELGGSLTGEHGVGSEKSALLGRQFDEPTRALFERIRAAFDPSGRMNPGKVLPSGAACREGGFPAGPKSAPGWV
jgi:glycolate dehydrogenase FAD-linked subunit